MKSYNSSLCFHKILGQDYLTSLGYILSHILGTPFMIELRYKRFLIPNTTWSITLKIYFIEHLSLGAF